MIAPIKTTGIYAKLPRQYVSQTFVGAIYSGLTIRKHRIFHRFSTHTKLFFKLLYKSKQVVFNHPKTFFQKSFNRN